MRARNHKHGVTRCIDQHEKIQCDDLQGVQDWLQEFKHGLVMKVFQHTEILPVLLMNYLFCREQKWYRINTTFLLTSRKTRIAISV